MKCKYVRMCACENRESNIQPNCISKALVYGCHTIMLFWSVKFAKLLWNVKLVLIYNLAPLCFNWNVCWMIKWHLRPITSVTFKNPQSFTPTSCSKWSGVPDVSFFPQLFLSCQTMNALHRRLSKSVCCMPIFKQLLHLTLLYDGQLFTPLPGTTINTFAVTRGQTTWISLQAISMLQTNYF